MNVLLATHGRPELLERTLQSLLIAASSGFITKIVLVENGGDFGAKSIVEKCNESGLITFTSISRANKSAALNEGLKLCGDGLIFLTDDDVVISRGIIEAYAEAAREYGPGSFFGGPTEAVYTEEPDELIKPFLPSSARGWSSSGALMDKDCMGFNWAAYRSDLLAVGGFSPEFGPGSDTGATGQESDMQRRLRRILKAQGRYVPDALVSHMVPPERCSREWVIKRAFRGAVEKGICLAQENLANAIKELDQKKRRARWRKIAATVIGGTARRFRCEYWGSWANGFEMGVTLVQEGKVQEPRPLPGSQK